MVDWSAYFISLGGLAIAAVLSWAYSVVRRDVSVVDSLWSLMIFGSLLIYWAAAGASGGRSLLLLVLVGAWALRLSLYITVRNHGEPEDRRYQEIRCNNEPRFWLKSLYIVFGLQALLAWFVSMPAVAAASAAPLGWLDAVGLLLWAAGMFFEVVGDWQLARFRRDRTSENAVLDTGLWRYTRHPNYFGEALLWWGIYLMALSAGAWWTLLSPLLMTFLLLRVSGVALLEKDMHERRPAYREYIEKTSAFIPAPPKQAAPAGN
jgi:steroid 5-alpha reductase family enzyme